MSIAEKTSRLKSDQLWETVRIAAKLLLCLLVDGICLAFRSAPARPRRALLVMRADGALGDYVLFRNFLTALKQDPRYRSHELWICGDVGWTPLASTVDDIDGFIEARRTDLTRDFRHRLSVLSQLKKLRPEVTLYPSATRDFFKGDLLVRAARAAFSTASAGIPNQAGYDPVRGVYCENPRWLLRIGDRFYDRLLSASPGAMFEFQRNRETFSAFLEREIDTARPTFPFGDRLPLEDRTSATVILGANTRQREWPVEHVSRWIDLILERTNLTVQLVGPADQSAHADRICSELQNGSRIRNVTGQTSVVELCELVSSSRILLCNESGPAHLAASLDVPYICPSNGNHFVRFHPYPAEMNVQSTYCYPFEIDDLTAEDVVTLSHFSILTAAEVPFAKVEAATLKELGIS